MVLNMAMNAPGSSLYANTNMFDILISVTYPDYERFSSEKKMVDDSKLNSKRQAKKSSATTVMTFEDVRSLPIKSLVDKFSEMTSEELTKKYSYKCLLLPHTCNKTFKSFGNEKKAYDMIKSHLLVHVKELTEDYESNREFSIVFIPKSPPPVSKSTDKFSKKSVKKQILRTLTSLDSPKSEKKVKSSTFCAKKVRKKINNANMKTTSGLKKCYSKDKMFDSVYVKDKFKTVKTEDDLSHPSKISDESGVACVKEKHTAYCSCLNCTFLSDTYIKEEVDEESPVEQEHDGICYEEMSTLSDLTDNISHEKPSVYLHDHNYAISDETKSEKPLSQDGKYILRENVELPSDNEMLPWYVVPTPPYSDNRDYCPYEPCMMEVSEIHEIGMEEVYPYDTDGFSSSMEYLNEDSNFKQEEEFQNELLPDHGEKYLSAINCKMNCGSATVLECVENRVNIKQSNGVPKSEISVSENDENSENMQRVEKELALKYIAKLHAKKKKKIPDSLFCQICPGKHFTAQATLIHHYRSHAGIKPYSCKICSSTFTRQHSLNYHMLIHQNRSRFTCDFCGRTFRHPSHYKEHLRRHTGETPFHCTDCSLHFKTRNTFKRHLKTRHGKLLTATGIETMSDDQFPKYIPKTKLGKQ